MEFLVPSVEVKENDLILKLCEKAERIVNLELKCDYLMKCLNQKDEIMIFI